MCLLYTESPDQENNPCGRKSYIGVTSSQPEFKEDKNGNFFPDDSFQNAYRNRWRKNDLKKN